MSEAKGTDADARRQAKEAENDRVLKRAMAYCWSENFLGRFRVFFTEHAYVFEEHARKNMRVR